MSNSEINIKLPVITKESYNNNIISSFNADKSNSNAMAEKLPYFTTSTQNEILKLSKIPEINNSAIVIKIKDIFSNNLQPLTQNLDYFNGMLLGIFD